MTVMVSMTRFTRLNLPAARFCPTRVEPATFMDWEMRLETLAILLAMPEKAETATP